MRETAWRTDEPCPVCGTGLVLVENGSPVLRAECRLCGYAGPFIPPTSRTVIGDHRTHDAGGADGDAAGRAM